MSYFSLYFLLKTGLYYTHYIGFHWGWNFLLALVCVLPIAQPAHLSPARWSQLRTTVLTLAALVLLYHDSHLPTPARVWSQLGTLNGFSSAYMLELLGRVIQPTPLLALVAIVVVFRWLSRRIRFSTFAFAAILSVPLMHEQQPRQPDASASTLASPTADATPGAALAGGDSNPQTQLQAFYTREGQRRLSFTTHGSPPAFDIILLHVCSLSWEDMDFVKEKNHPLFKRFDLVFSNFNSAASYSGPASIRVLRGTCGQSPHAKLYENTDPQCYVFPNLEKLGYRASGLLNHDGLFDKFADALEQRTGLKGKLERPDGAPVALRSFDGSPIYDDGALLSRWWKQREGRPSKGEALYYNSVSLHDGNRIPGNNSLNSLETYKPRMDKLMMDLDKFVSQLEASGRPIVLMLVPEHGASLRGDKIQISGMREIPSPGITLVPAAVKLIGLKRAEGALPTVVAEPVSFFGLYSLLGDLLSDNPYLPNARPLTARVDKLERTPFVAENDDVVVMRRSSGDYWIKSGDSAWAAYKTP